MTKTLRQYLPMIIIGLVVYFLIIKPAAKGASGLIETIQDTIERIASIPRNAAEYIDPDKGLGYTLKGG